MENLVTIIGGQPVTTSLKVAEVFGKLHKDVLRAIRNLESQIPAEVSQRNFAPSSYEQPQPNGGTKLCLMYHITRDGFTLLAMGFTGKAAMQFKLAYIEAFNAMEAQLRAGKLDLLASTIRMLDTLNRRIAAGEDIPPHILKYAWNMALCTRTRAVLPDPEDMEIRQVFSAFAPGERISKSDVYRAYCDKCSGGSHERPRLLAPGKAQRRSHRNQKRPRPLHHHQFVKGILTMIRPSDDWIRRENRRHICLYLRRAAEVLLWAAMIAVIIWGRNQA